jgi:hypothetical protein
MRSLNATLTSAYGAAVQFPAWMILIDFNTPQRYCTGPTTTWNSQTWTATDVDVTRLKVGALAINGELVFGNADDVMGGIALGEGFADKRIRIWGWDATITSPAVDVPVLVCDGVGGKTLTDLQRVRVEVRHPCEYKIGLRHMVTPEFGFTKLIPAGRTMTINGQSYKLERGR